MVGSGKILTVSYGTFSCTLEGFDDSFDTMKAIAEYFRDLAADDRYFGAEPPTPDAEMLARIAEREISRRVEARMDATGIVLRPALSEPDDASEVAAAKPDVAMPPQPRAPQAKPVARNSDALSRAAAAAAAISVEDDIEDAPQITPPPASAPAAAAPAFNPAPDSVAAKLQRIRAVVGRSQAGTLAENYVEDLSDQNEAFETPASDAMVFEDESDLAETPINDEVFEDDAEDVTADATPMATEFEETDPELDQADDDIDAEELPTEEDQLDSTDLDEDEGDTDELDDIFAEDESEPASLDALEVDETEEPENFDAILAELAEEDEDAPVDEPLALDDDANDDLADLDDQPDESQFAQYDDEAEDDDTLTDQSPEAESTSEAEPEPEPSILDRARARVIRVRRPEPQPAEVVEETAETAAPAEDTTEVIAEETTEVIAEDIDEGVNVAELDGLDDLEGYGPPSGSTLSPEDEAELARDLAETDDNFGEIDDALVDDLEDVDVDEADEDDLDADELDEPRAARPGRALLDSQPDDDDGVMSRILSQTDAEMAEPSARNRRQAITQMKAAVAATEAARRLGDTVDGGKKAESSFRKDLSQVVRPTRTGLVPVEGGSKALEARSERPRPAPLRLVASQRVDLVQEPTQSDVVRPRRVSAAPSTAAVSKAATSGTFAEFAKESGARSLAEILEAAAAYVAFVEGAPEFSRPHVLQLAQQASDEGFSREDGLRSFGTLLRDGRINKIANGRFKVSQDSRYRPDLKAAEG